MAIMTEAGQSTPPGTGGSIDEAVQNHAGILAAEDNQDEGEAAAEAEDAEADTVDEELEGAEDEEAVDDDGDSEDEDAEGDEEAESDEADEDGDDEDDDGDEDDSDPVFKVKVDGEEVEVKQSELIAGYTRQADYTRKTMALGEERKAFNQEAEAVRAERQQYVTLLEKLQEQVASGGEQEPDWDKLYAENPNEWVRQRELHRSKRERNEAIEAEKARVNEAEQAEREKAIQAYRAEEAEKLKAAIPEFADEEKAATARKRLREYARDTVGYSDEELSRLSDHRAVVLFDKARKYDELVSKRGKVKPEKGKGAPKTAKPGNTRSGSNASKRAVKQSRERLANSGSLDDAAALIMNSLE